MSPPKPDPVRAAFRGFLLDIALNAIFPVVLHRLSKRYISPSEFTALAVATTFPLGKSIFDLAKHRKLDPGSRMGSLNSFRAGLWAHGESTVYETSTVF
jgi:hypothetical protein